MKMPVRTQSSLSVSFLHRLLPIAALVLSILALPLQAQDDDFDDMDIDQPEHAPSAGGFGIFVGSSFSLTTLKPTDLDPDLDETLLYRGGLGYAILSHWLVGGGGASVDLQDPNSSYDRFQLGYGGFLTGYDQLLTDDLSIRGSLLVGSGELSMIKNRPDLDSLSEHPFLEQYREENFFLVKPQVSVGYVLFSIFDLRLTGGYWLPFGAAEVEDLRQFTFGLDIMIGFRNNILQ